MDRISELVAAPDPVSIGGKTYLMHPLRAKHYGEAERFMIAQRPRPMDVVLSKLAEVPKEFHQNLLDAAFQFELRGQWIPKNEVLLWLCQNAEGRVFTFWRMLTQEPSQADISIEQAEALMAQLAKEEKEFVPNLGMPEGKADSRTQNSANPVRALLRGGRYFASWVRRMVSRQRMSAT